MIITNDDMKLVMTFCDGVSWHVHGVTVDKHEVYQDNWFQTEISIIHCADYWNESHTAGSYLTFMCS